MYHLDSTPDQTKGAKGGRTTTRAQGVELDLTPGSLRWAGLQLPQALRLAVEPLSMSKCEFVYLLNTHRILKILFISALTVTLLGIELVHHPTNNRKVNYNPSPDHTGSEE